MEKCTHRLFILKNCNSHIYFIKDIILHANSINSTIYLKLVVFDCANSLIKTCAMTISFFFVNMPSGRCAVVILLRLDEVFGKIDTYVKILQCVNLMFN